MRVKRISNIDSPRDIIDHAELELLIENRIEDDTVFRSSMFALFSGFRFSAVAIIKRFPFPRHYGSFTFVFVCIFVFLLPFGVVGEFSKLGGDMYWLSVPIGALIGWIFVVLEIVGDYSENPFEGLYNDVPMLSICRTIEIDLLQMLGEKTSPNQYNPRTAC